MAPPQAVSRSFATRRPTVVMTPHVCDAHSLVTVLWCWVSSSAARRRVDRSRGEAHITHRASRTTHLAVEFGRRDRAVLEHMHRRVAHGFGRAAARLRRRRRRRGPTGRDARVVRHIAHARRRPFLAAAAADPRWCAVWCPATARGGHACDVRLRATVQRHGAFSFCGFVASSSLTTYNVQAQTRL